jgi:anti-sigma factor RsiW
MCDERERLIEYVYGEVEPGARERIEAHLGECHVCRAEVTGLRGVRDDLLAWGVPRHEPIWRPFVPAPAEPLKRSWPAWTLAAAAGALFTAGLAGGMAARGWMPAGPGPGTAVAQVVSAADAQTVSRVSAEDLAALETAILERVRAEMSQRLSSPAVQTPAAAVAVVRDSNPLGTDPTEARLAAIEQWMDDQTSLNAAFYGQFGRLNSRTSNLSEQLEVSLRRVSLASGGR